MWFFAVKLHHLLPLAELSSRNSESVVFDESLTTNYLQVKNYSC